jgi:hypothetical protein
LGYPVAEYGPGVRHRLEVIPGEVDGSQVLVVRRENLENPSLVLIREAVTCDGLGVHDMKQTDVGLGCAHGELPADLTAGAHRKPIAPAWGDALVEGFLTWLRAQSHSEGPIDVRRWDVGRLAEVCADPWDVTTQQLAEWLSNPDWGGHQRRVPLHPELRSAI